jgi:hypothetical protein
VPGPKRRSAEPLLDHLGGGELVREGADNGKVGPGASVAGPLLNGPDRRSVANGGGELRIPISPGSAQKNRGFTFLSCSMG